MPSSKPVSNPHETIRTRGPRARSAPPGPGRRLVLEGVLVGPVALDVTGWMNTDGEALELEELRGKVVVLKFWGTW